MKWLDESFRWLLMCAESRLFSSQFNSYFSVQVFFYITFHVRDDQATNEMFL